MADMVTLRCHAELNDFLPRKQRQAAITVACAGHETVKHVVESSGVPHPEVAALLINGVSVSFRAIISAGDRIDAYPVSVLPTLRMPLIVLRPPLQSLHFVLDAHLGRLAAYLRMLGFDTLYSNSYDDPELAQLAYDDKRMLLTRDIGLLKRSLVTHGYFVRETMPEQQFSEVVRRFRLVHVEASFQRCIRCNGMTRSVEKATIAHLLEPKTRLYYNEFRQCDACGQVYWRGSHYQHMQQFVERVLREQAAL